MTQVTLVRPNKVDSSGNLLSTGVNPSTDMLNVPAQSGDSFVVSACATGNIDLATFGGAGEVIDGVTLALDQYVLLPLQTTAGEIGIYKINSTNLTIDPVSSYRFVNKQFGLTQVMDGTANGGKFFQQNTKSTTFNGTIFSTPLVFTDLFDNVPSSYSAGNLSTFVATVAVAAGDVVAYDINNVGQIVLCDAASGSTSKVAIGVVMVGASAGGNAQVVTTGEVTVTGTPFTAAQMGANLFVDPATAGAYTLTAPTTAGNYLILVGQVMGANKINVQGSMASSPL